MIPVATKHFFSAVASEHLENGVDVDDRVVMLKSVGDDESAGRGLEDGERDGSDVVV